MDGLSWHWVFYVNLPLGLIALAFGSCFLDEHRPPDPGPDGAARFDLPGLLLSATGLAGLTYGICSGAARGWTSPGIVIALTAGTVLLAATVLVELRTTQPLLNLRLLQNRLFRDFNFVAFLGSVPFMGAMFLGPLFIQNVLGGSALDSGTSTFTEAFGILLVVQLAGHRYTRTGPRLITGLGLLGVTAVLLLFATCDLQTSLWTFRLYMFLLGAAMGAVFMPTNVAALSQIRAADMSQAQTLNSVIRQVAGALGPATVTTLLVAGGGHSSAPGSSLSAYQHTYLGLAAICLAATLLAFTRRDADARRAAAGPAMPAQATPTSAASARRG